MQRHAGHKQNLDEMNVRQAIYLPIYMYIYIHLYVHIFKQSSALHTYK